MRMSCNISLEAYLPGPDRMDVATDLKQTKRHVNETRSKGGPEINIIMTVEVGDVVVGALRYKPAGRGFDSR